MQIILIGNYSKDKQESMQRFAEMVCIGYQKAGYECIVWRPGVVLGSTFKNTNKGFGKWAGYIDKWIIFPVILKRRIKNLNGTKKNCSFHICDHSNSPYLKQLPIDRTIITCHDVLAIMGALGYENTYCEASRIGKILQKMILNNLTSAKKLAAVSEQTLKQLCQIAQTNILSKEWRVIYNGFNNNFNVSHPVSISKISLQSGLAENVPFILHVGSDLPRKNRRLLIDMVSLLGDKWNGKICYAGEKVGNDLLNYAASLGLKDQIINIVKPDHEMLIKLYCNCEAFIFPSFSEGFGWPVIEAQSCGSPVIVSNVEPMPEISGGAALHCDPKSPQEFANAFYSLRNKDLRNVLIQKGFINSLRFNNNQMIAAYLDLHRFKFQN